MNFLLGRARCFRKCQWQCVQIYYSYRRISCRKAVWEFLLCYCYSGCLGYPRDVGCGSSISRIWQVFQQHITIRSEKLPASNGTREVKLAVTGCCFIKMHHKTVLHTDIFAVRDWTERTHRIEDVVDPGIACVNLAECLEVVDKIHHNPDAIRPNLANHFNNKFWAIENCQYMCFNYYGLTR